MNAWLWGPAGGNVAGSAGQAGQRRRFCWSGGVDGVGGLGWCDGVGDRVGAVRWGRVVGALGRRRHLGGRADVVSQSGGGDRC